jgi:hypothetical protein
MGFNNLLQYLEDYSTGLYVLIFMIFALLLAINWLAYIFNWGRYRYNAKHPIDRKSKMSYLVAEFFANIINDFKHLLALVIVFIFVLLILYGTVMGENFEQKKEALQLVIASLGGLLAAIIGYYFGESAATKANVPFLTGLENSDKGGEAIQGINKNKRRIDEQGETSIEQAAIEMENIQDAGIPKGLKDDEPK